MKVLTHGQEFLGHKGGFLQPLWKGKGPIDDPASFRSILISSHIGKALHRTLRESQCSIFETFLQTEQIGGRKKVPVNLGVHMCRAFMRAHKAAGDSVGMIYLDLKEAFYRIVRQLATGGNASDALLAKVCARFGLPEGVLHDLHCHLSQPAALLDAGLPQHARNAVQALHEDTFFRVKGQRDCCRTELGTRPGDCYADVIFSYIWCRILKLLQGELQRLDIGEEICTDEGIHVCADRALPAGVPRPFLGPTWMDDTCICVSSCTAIGVESKTIHAAGLLLQFCEQHALTPNLQKGKTEVLFAFQGTGSRSLKKKYFGPQSDQCMHILAEHGLKKIQVVSKYAHLGCMMHHKSDNRHEARKRIAIAQQTFTQHQRYLLRNPQLSLKRRRELFHSLVMSRLCYGAESWTLSDQKTKDFVHGALIRLFRRLIFNPLDQHMTDDQVLSATGLNSPSEVLRLARLRYVGTLFQCQGVVPWGLLNADQAWLVLIEDDIRWMWTQLRDSCSLPDPDVNFQAWQNIIQNHRSYWRRLVRRAGEHACRQRRNQQLVCDFHCQFIDTLKEVKAGLAETATAMFHEHVVDTQEIHACMACKERFRSKGGLGAHNFKRYHQVSPVRLLFDTTCCGACLKEYHTTNKLKSHLLRSSLCRRTLLGQRLRVEPVPGAGSSDDTARSRDHDGLLPPLQGEGPVLPTGRMIDLSPYDLELIEAIYLNIVENESETSSEDVVRFVIENHVISWTRCRDTLKQMLAELTSDDIEILAEHRRDLRDVLERLQQPDAWTFLQDTVRAKSGALQSVEHYEAVFEQHLHDHHDPIWSIPRPMGRERFIIHAFSGRRRPGDVQFFLDGLQAQPDGTSIFTISLDVIIDEEFGDVSRESVRDFWLRGIRERAVIGMLAGPPCETWSQARGKSLSSSSNLLHRKAPRIIRDRTCLWGKAALALRELEQLHLGNLLLLFTIEMLIHLAVQGGVGAMEHPAPPNDEALASVWHLFIIRYLCAWPEFLRIELAQGLWGATSPKPTSLLLLNLPKMPQVLRSWQVTKCLPGAKSIGQNEDGSWRTSQLKEYPPALCAGLAQGLFEAINDHKVDSALTMDGNFRAQAMRLTVSSYGSHFGPDFAPHG